MSTKISKISKISKKRCLCITASGKRCSREGTYSGYCFQHNNKCTKSIKITKMKRSPKKRVTATKKVITKPVKPKAKKVKNLRTSTTKKQKTERKTKFIPKIPKTPKKKSIQKITFTGIPEVDRQILLRLHSKDLTNACSTDVYTKSLCTNEFWKDKIKIEFPKYVSRKHKEHKSYKRVYNTLYLKQFPPITEEEKFIKKKMDKTKSGYFSVFYPNEPRESFRKPLEKIGAKEIFLGNINVEFQTDSSSVALKVLQFLAKKRFVNHLNIKDIKENLHIDGDLIRFSFDY